MISMGQLEVWSFVGKSVGIVVTEAVMLVIICSKEERGM